MIATAKNGATDQTVGQALRGAKAWPASEAKFIYKHRRKRIASLDADEVQECASVAEMCAVLASRDGDKSSAAKLWHFKSLLQQAHPDILCWKREDDVELEPSTAKLYEIKRDLARAAKKHGVTLEQVEYWVGLDGAEQTLVHLRF